MLRTPVAVRPRKGKSGIEFLQYKPKLAVEISLQNLEKAKLLMLQSRSAALRVVVISSSGEEAITDAGAQLAV